MSDTIGLSCGVQALWVFEYLTFVTGLTVVPGCSVPMTIGGPPRVPTQSARQGEINWCRLGRDPHGATMMASPRKLRG